MGILNYIDEKTADIRDFLDKIDDEAREIKAIVKPELNDNEEYEIEQSTERIKDYCKDIQGLL